MTSSGSGGHWRSHWLTGTIHWVRRAAGRARVGAVATRASTSDLVASLTGHPKPSAPRLNIEWQQRTSDHLKPILKARAAERDISVRRYKKDIERHLTALLEAAEIRVRIAPEHLAEALALDMEDPRLKSLFETGHSGGLNDPVRRAETELALFGYPEDLHPTDRPIYGYLLDATEDSFETHLLGDYGTVVVCLFDNVKRRTSFLVGDTLADTQFGTKPVVAPSSVLRPRWFSENFRFYNQARDPLDARSLDEFPFYVEAHVHGGVVLADIRRVVIFRPHDLRDLSPILEDRGIDYGTNFDG